MDWWHLGQSSFKVEDFLYPRIEKIIQFFDAFKKLYLDSFLSYQTDKEVDALFPNPCKATILGSKDGLKGFKIKNSVNLFDQWHDSGVWYDEQYDMWAGHNIRMNFANIETIEIQDSLLRYERKDDITRSDWEFQNVVDKVIERKQPEEIYRATHLLVKFGDIRLKKMIAETNGSKQRSFPKIILPFYRQAVEVGSQIMDMTQVKKNKLRTTSKLYGIQLNFDKQIARTAQHGVLLQGRAGLLWKKQINFHLFSGCNWSVIHIGLLFIDHSDDP